MVGSDATGSRNRRGSALVVLAALAATGLADASHIVAPGENLWTIAKQYATTPAAIAQANHITDPDLIAIGRHLRIPTAPPAPAPAAPPTSLAAPVSTSLAYTVRSGDNLTAIASRYHVAVGALATLNGITKPNLVRMGQVINIPIPSLATVEGLLIKYSKAFKIDPALVKALAWQESGWQQQVISSAGAVGVMQLMPGTGRFTGMELLQKEVDPAKLEHNVEAGVAFLAFLLAKTKGDQRLAVAGYYQGLRSVKAGGMLPETKRYVANVMALKDRFSR